MSISTVVIDRNARMFITSPPGSNSLVFSGAIAEAGTKFRIPAPKSMTFLGEEGTAINVIGDDGRAYWIFAEEAGLDIDSLRGIEQVWHERAEAQRAEMSASEVEFFKELGTQQAAF